MSRPFPNILDAVAIASRAHRGQVDKAGKPYIAHPAIVAGMLSEHGDNAIMAGWLHDVVEDSAVTLDDLRAAGFPEDVVAAVDSVTKRPGETYLDLVRRAAADPLGRLVKLADNLTNSDPERLALLDEPTRGRLTRKYAAARVILTEAGAKL